MNRCEKTASRSLLVVHTISLDVVHHKLLLVCLLRPLLHWCLLRGSLADLLLWGRFLAIAIGTLLVVVSIGRGRCLGTLAGAWGGRRSLRGLGSLWSG